MKETLDHLNDFRVPNPTNGHMGGPQFGMFKLPKFQPVAFSQIRKPHFVVIASAGDPSEGIPWEHVSVHGRYYTDKGEPRYFTPSWADMCWIKDQFFDPEECVMQLHVPASDHVNTHEHTLHLWRPTDVAIPLPPSICV